MRAFIGQLDGITATVVIIGLAIGTAWLVALPVGLLLAGLVAPIGVVLLVIGRRWLEAGLLLVAIGVVPTVAYRIVGPPPLPTALPDGLTPAELLAPGGAYLLFLVGIIAVGIDAFFEVRHGQRRERQEIEHRRRRSERLGDNHP